MKNVTLQIPDYRISLSELDWYIKENQLFTNVQNKLYQVTSLEDWQDDKGLVTDVNAVIVDRYDLTTYQKISEHEILDGILNVLYR
jgi:hypothetical protein